MFTVDGLHFTFEFKGILIDLVVTNFVLHIKPGSLLIKGENVRGTIIFKNLSLLLNASFVDIHDGIIILQNLSLTISSTGFVVFENIDLDLQFLPDQTKVFSKRPIHVKIPFEILDSVLELLDLFASDQPPEFIPLPAFDIQLVNISIELYISEIFSIQVKIQKAFLVDKIIQIDSIFADMILFGVRHHVILPFSIEGKLEQINRSTFLNLSLQQIRLNISLRPELFKVLQNLPQISFKSSITIPQRKFEFSKQIITLRDLPHLNYSENEISFEFDSLVIPCTLR